MYVYISNSTAMMLSRAFGMFTFSSSIWLELHNDIDIAVRGQKIYCDMFFALRMTFRRVIVMTPMLASHF